MKASAFLYPWDVVGDPDAARRLVDLGVQQATLASAYHSTRALTPRHPRHLIVTAPHSAVYYPTDELHWSGQALYPYPQDWVAGPDPYGEAAAALADAGIEVHSWVVLAHSTVLGEEHSGSCVVNAFGDRYLWAPCIARPEVRAYLTLLAAEAAVRPGTHGTELESCGWYGLAHLHAHDKIAGVPFTGAGQYLMSLCFCADCRDGYDSLGEDPDALRAAVAGALAPLRSGEPVSGGGDRAAEWTEVERLLGAHRAAVVAQWRHLVAHSLQREVVAAVRDAAYAPGFRVLLHADPAPHRCGANVGVEPAEILSFTDGLVLPCTGGPQVRADSLAPFAPHRTAGTTLAANFTIVAGMGGSPATLAEDAAHAKELGADEIRLYHAGLASDADLAAVRVALSRLD
ncbi:hypothetical protein [Streptomyces sp. NPDC058989]|uniref:hypothetical protein n=1 Tax=Streptomyces sp. NPDC058989 TaxID=3346686 RepID=UPI0036C60F40